LDFELTLNIYLTVYVKILVLANLPDYFFKVGMVILEMKTTCVWRNQEGAFRLLPNPAAKGP